jgi:hypothetical protein
MVAAENGHAGVVQLLLSVVVVLAGKDAKDQVRCGYSILCSPRAWLVLFQKEFCLDV